MGKRLMLQVQPASGTDRNPVVPVARLQVSPALLIPFQASSERKVEVLWEARSKAADDIQRKCLDMRRLDPAELKKQDNVVQLAGSCDSVPCDVGG